MNTESTIWDVFYDECKADGYWHCFLFIPKNKIVFLDSLIQQARECSNYRDPIHYTNIGRKTKNEDRRVVFIKVLTDILLYIIQQQKLDAVINWNGTTQKINAPYVGARVAILRMLNNHETQSIPQKLIEATFRMAIKGPLHYLFTDEHPIIDTINVDFSTSSFQNSFDESNLWERVKNELNKNITFTPSSSITCISKKDYLPDCPFSQIMQFVDVILGSFRTCVVQNTEFVARYFASEPIRSLLLKDYKNIARMKNSRYYKGYSLTDAHLNDQWVFKPIKIENDKNQYDIFEDF
ncbi:MAG: hypothetical protein RBR69_05815 [Candidatus Cloacimonadaceae bacterium]|jgi:hypothetical protein|nr:hypothetical protein [Candidatus Cloacimonadota bacterium]MCB5254167.1 hypothetical protein [Candidatus Cloacimonadota bacterium]MCK9242193.1 hypothetical protein [Candidatus Cloacimonadota bacterium]MDY0127629.1 hypothetical protein [Candidatus Cloacimonadaceae bacterium]